MGKRNQISLNAVVNNSVFSQKKMSLIVRSLQLHPLPKKASQIANPVIHANLQPYLDETVQN